MPTPKVLFVGPDNSKGGIGAVGKITIAYIIITSQPASPTALCSGAGTATFTVTGTGVAQPVRPNATSSINFFIS